MAFIKDWALTVCVAYVLAAVISTLAPKGPSNSGVRLVVTLFTLLAMLSPLLKIGEGGIDLGIKPVQAATYDAFAEVAQKAGETAKEQLCAEIKEKYGISVSVLNLKLFNDGDVIKCNHSIIEIDMNDSGHAQEVKAYAAKVLGTENIEIKMKR